MARYRATIRSVVDHRKIELAEFLRTRRAALTPAETGIATYGTPRRVPGLRREEVAFLAGMSVNYYTRLEQGESHQMSDSVLEAIAGALRLDETERSHLRHLIRPPVSLPVRHDPGPPVIRDAMRSLVEADAGKVTYLIDQRLDVLTGNRLFYALYGLRPGQPLNLARQIFLEQSSRDLLTNWERAARNMAANLRVSTGTHPDDPRLAELIGELSIKTPDFVRLWAEHPVMECTHSVIEYDHPQVGRLVLSVESLRVTDDLAQQVCYLSAEPGSDSAGRLRLLAALTS
jgi:transcriptional regulator with XRE-family HTH domain